MTSKKIADSIFNIKEKLTDKEFKDIMDLLSIKNKEEKEDKVELYEFTYMKMRKPEVFKFDHSSYTYGYNFANYKIKTKKVIIDPEFYYMGDIITDETNYLQRVAFKLSKVKNKNYYKLSKGIFCGGPIDNCITEDYFKNPFTSDNEDEDNDCDCDYGCDKCFLPNEKKRKGVNIMYRKMIGISIKKMI
jgi:hypothetical protein